MRMSTVSGVQEENTEFWARQFAGRWYRGAAQVENDFRRFAIAYRVPPRMRARVMARALGLVGDGLRAA
jgi:transposase InsO family protein